MPHPWFSVWLIHPKPEACEAFERRFAGLPDIRVIQQRYEQLPPHDCFVTAGNAYGVMTAGIDAAIIDRFGEGLMREVQEHIMEHYLGEQPVGTAFVVPTNDPARPQLCHAPTMRTPGAITGTSNIYTATFAALTAVHRYNVCHDDELSTVVFPAMGTGFGQVSFDEAARQMAVAYRHYLRPSGRPTWDSIVARERRICYDGDAKVVRA
ncbi:macro domain-containing protein [Enhygromyxa salina]|uniref:RNase III inhibitor n=1 Tax=Enhygromyxa salina TaxID=215803 RepID=A0A2S9XLC5_9BACT|nr:macro domain-containing protein [Enhygromyxa salina]PRP93653.1 RNase III inhibitor [Enhygromyxa salina]